jgi:hypothetical protein
MKAEVDGRAVRLPDFLVVGAAKSGTTSLYHYLKQHPGIFMPDIKEPHFFTYGGKKPPHEHPRDIEAVWDFADYADLFDKVGGGQVLGEASPLYLYRYEASINNIKEYVPSWQDLRIVIILRDPVERAWSQYRGFRMADLEDVSFEDALHMVRQRIAGNWRPDFDYTGFGLYYNQVKAYIDNFSDVKVCLFDDLEADALGLVRDVYRFLGVDYSFAPDVRERHNPSCRARSWALYKFLKKPDLVSAVFPLVKVIPLEKRVLMVKRLQSLNVDFSKARMKEETRRHLRALYRKDVLKLQELIGRDLSGWLQ